MIAEEDDEETEEKSMETLGSWPWNYGMSTCLLFNSNQELILRLQRETRFEFVTE
jgi:hypothetical protein